MKEHIYFVSTGRCGTTFLYNFYAQYAPELKISHQETGSRLMNIVANTVLSTSFLKRHIAFFYRIILNQKEPHSTVDPLQSIAIYLFTKYSSAKNIKIVHVVRHPSSYVTSYMNWKTESIRKRVLHNLVPFWSPRPFYRQKNTNSLPLFSSKFEKFCWLWNFKNSLFEGLGTITPSYLRIKFEDIVDRELCAQTLEKINEFIDLPSSGEDIENCLHDKKNKSSRKTFPASNEWTEEMNTTLKYYCETRMKRYGYAI